MESFILAWVLVVAPSTNQNSPIISDPVYDLASCQRMQTAVRRSSVRSTQCVEVRVPVIKVPKVQEECKVEE